MPQGGRMGSEYNTVEDHFTVLKRDEHIYAQNLDDLMELFRAMQNVLEELGFGEIEEDYSEHWESMPFKSNVEAKRWKDPYTAIELFIKSRVKSPRSDRKTTEDTYKVKIVVKASVIRMKYPVQPRKHTLSRIQRTPIYKWLWRLANNRIFNKELERYKEEAEELGLEYVSRMREIEGSIPAIGRSKREYYNPDDPGGYY